jgi:hypothetical protein
LYLQQLFHFDSCLWQQCRLPAGIACNSQV